MGKRIFHFTTLVGVVAVLLILLQLVNEERIKVASIRHPSPTATVMSIRFGDCFDFERNRVVPTSGLGGNCVGSAWDIYFAYNSLAEPHATVVQNMSEGVQLAYSPVSTLFNDASWQTVSGLGYSVNFLDQQFNGIAVVLTGLGNYYKLELLEENGRRFEVSFQWEQIENRE